MPDPDAHTGLNPPLARYRSLVRSVLDGERPEGAEFDAARALVRGEPHSAASLQALCALLEGALADPTLPSDETQILVPLLKDLARGRVKVADVV